MKGVQTVDRRYRAVPRTNHLGVAEMLKRTKTIVALASVLMLAFGVWPGLTFGVPDPVEGQVTTDPGHQLSPAMSGDRIVWKDFRNGDYDVYGFDLSTGAEFPVSVAPGLQQNPAIDGDYVVWQDYRNGNWEIYLRDLSTGEETRLTDDSAIQQNPRVSGERVVWDDYRDGNWDIYSYDISTGGLSRLTDDPARQRNADIHGDIVVWEDFRGSSSDIWVLDLSTGEAKALQADSHSQGGPDVYGDTVVWQDDRNGNWDIFAYDLTTGSERQLTNDPSMQTGPQVAASAVVWQDYRNGNWDIYLGDLTTGEEKQMTFDAAPQWNAQSDGGDIVWEDFRNANGDIYMARLQVSMTRVAGADRYDTAAAISGLSYGDTADTVVLATGDGFADALAASGLAGALDAPLLLTAPGHLPEGVAQRIIDLGATEAVLIGGPSAVSDTVVGTLEGMGLSVERIAGDTRYSTSAAVATRIAQITGGQFVLEAFVVRGDAFADALAVSPYAFARKMPVLLTDPRGLSPETAQVIGDLGLESVVVAGGESAVSGSVASALGVPSTRVFGEDRYGTALAVAEFSAERGWGSWSFIGVATGADFPDALVGGAIVGKNGGLLLMTEPGELNQGVRDSLASRITAIDTVRVFGGASAVSDAVCEQIEALW